MRENKTKYISDSVPESILSRQRACRIKEKGSLHVLEDKENYVIDGNLVNSRIRKLK